MVRIARNIDSRVLAEMAVQMWDSHTVDELEAEFAETLNDKQANLNAQMQKTAFTLLLLKTIKLLDLVMYPQTTIIPNKP